MTFLASDGNTYSYKQLADENVSSDIQNLTFKSFTIQFPDGLLPPEGAAKLIFTYSTTADLTNAAAGVNKFYNDIKVGNKESSAEYVYYKPSIVKTDGNGASGTTQVANEDGSLTWKIRANAGDKNKKLVLTDKLPEGVSLVSLSLSGWGNLNMELSVNGSEISGTDSTGQYTVNGTYSDNIITLNIVPQTEGNTITAGAEFTLTVNCQVIDPASQTETKSLMNTVEMKLDGVDIGSSNQTQEWSYQQTVEETKVVDKTGEWKNNSRIMDYKVILNEEGKDLLEGSDTLTLTDTMTYYNQFTIYWPTQETYNIEAALVQSSVKLYKAVKDENGEWIAGEAVNDWNWTYESKTDQYENNKMVNIITATNIPDDIPLLLKYSYRITSNVPDKIGVNEVTFSHQFWNTAKLEGMDQ